MATTPAVTRQALTWLRAHDPAYSALRRAARTAIVMPAMFAFGTKVVGDPNFATFAAFGSFATLLLVDFAGPMRERIQSQIGLGVAGLVLVTVATLTERPAGLAAVAMAVAAFLVLFSGVVSSVLAGASTALLLSFMLPVTQPGDVSTLGERLLGWGSACAVSVFAISLLWPGPVRDPLRGPAAAACRSLAAVIRADVAELLEGGAEAPAARVEADDAMASLRRAFVAGPSRPTGLRTATRALVRLVDELTWLHTILAVPPHHPAGHTPRAEIVAVKRAIADVLDQCATSLTDPLDAARDLSALTQARRRLAADMRILEDDAAMTLPVRRATVESEDHIQEFLTSLEPSFRAQELAFASGQIAANVSLAVAADQRPWLDRVLGRQPVDPAGQTLAGPVAAARERAFAHADRHSVWLRNSIRSAIGLGLAVLVADLTNVQHSFWVVFATLSVLRSSALNTGQNIARGLVGTAIGFVIGAGVIAVIGTNTVVLWVLLPIVVLFAGIAPATISFAAGQAAFTVTLVILFNLVAPAGWRVGLVRIEDLAIGCGVSLAVGLLLWPRGAASALRHALAEAYDETARYLAAAVEFGVQRCDHQRPVTIAPPTSEATRAAAAARRLDDTYRTYLAEPGAKARSREEVNALVTTVTGLRLAADAVLDLWARDGSGGGGDRTAARAELAVAGTRIEHWYDELADDLRQDRPLPAPLDHDGAADQRLIAAVRRDLHTADGAAGSTAARMIWTADHLDAARRLQGALVPG